MSRLDDTGAFLPFAKKHLVAGRENGDLSTNLKELWPEPDWQVLCDEGMPVDVCAHLAVYYSGWRNHPRPSQPSVTSEQWLEAFVQSVAVLKELYDDVADMADVKRLPDLFRSRMGVPKTKGKQHIRDVYPLYALGRGENRTYKTPFALTLRQSALIKLLPSIGWPYTVSPNQVNLFPVSFDDGYYSLCTIQGRRYFLKDSEEFPNRFQSEHDAIETLCEHMKLDRSPYVPRKKIEEIRNVKLGYDVTPQQFIDTFKFRGVQFGNSMPDRERQLFLNNSYYAFKVLAHLLNIPDSWIGLGGQLGIAFGARGQGGASAHYEADLNIINLTRRSGPGSISHEWFHAVDALLARTRGFEGRLVSELLPEMNLKDAPDKYRENINLLTGIVTKQLAPSTKYYKRSQNLASQKGVKKYWIDSGEMLARAFESFIQDAMSQKEIVCDWLAMGTQLNDEPEEHQDKNPYPQGDERKHLNHSMAKLMQGMWGK